MDSVLMEYDYNRYLEQVMYEQDNMELYVRKVLAVNEAYDPSAERQVFTEAVTDRIKNTWSKFVAWIKKTFAKFIERLTNAVSKEHRAYLDKYKDTILKKRVKPGYTVTMPNHAIGVQRIFDTGYTVDPIQPNDVSNFINICKMNVRDGKLKDATDEETRTTLITEGTKTIGAWSKLRAIYDHNDVKITDDMTRDEKRARVKAFFVGGQAKEIPTDSAELNMSDMFEFCYNAEKSAAKVKTDTENFEKSCNNIIATVDGALRKGAADSQAAAAAKGAPAKPSEANGNRALDMMNNQAQQDAKLGEAALLEADGDATITKTTTTTTNTTQQNGKVTNAKAGEFNIKPNNNDTDAYKQGAEKVGKDIDNNTSDIASLNKTINMVNNALASYRDEAVNVLTGKMNAIVQISKDYMALIRTHVQTYIGEKDNVADTTRERQTTEYNSPEGNAPKK